MSNLLGNLNVVPKPPTAQSVSPAPAGSTSTAPTPKISGAIASITATPTRPVVYQPNVAIVGDTGTGKTTSLRNLDWSQTLFVDAEQKGLSFAADMPYYAAPRTSFDIEKAMFSPSAPAVVVLDSLTKYIELLDAEMNAAHKGFEVWAQYNMRMQQFLNRCKSTERTFIVTAIPEILTLTASDGVQAENVRRIRTRGKQWEGQIEKEFAFVFYTVYKTDMKAAPPKTVYQFQTNAAGMNRAKSPMGCFEELYIDNDISAALKQMRAHLKLA